MQVRCDEGIASHIGPESCGCVREGVVEALTGEGMDWVLSLENVTVRSADGFLSSGRRNHLGRQRETLTNSAWSKAPATYRHTSRERQPAALLGVASSFTEAGRSLVWPRCVSGSAS